MNKKNQKPIDKQEWDNWTDITKRIEFTNGKIPKEAFFAWCESFYTVPIEFMGVRFVDNEPEILLIYRKDEYYDGYHTPGAVLTPGKKIKDMLDSLIKVELGENIEIKNIQFVKHFETFKGSGVGENLRGHEIKMVFSGIIKGEPKDGEWFKKENLPENIIPEFKFIIPEILNWAKKNLI